jgi:uncharacterized protein with HEPN domain
MRRDDQRLIDILEADFVANETPRYAVAQKLTAVWRRNIVVHEYFGICWPFVWKTAVDHAPVLRS